MADISKIKIESDTYDIKDTTARNNGLYSTTETIIGKWINNENLYRIVLTGTTVDGDLDIDVESLNIGYIRNIYGMTLNGRPLNFYYFGYGLSTRYSLGHIYLNASTPYAGDTFYMIVEYTKSV